MEWGQESVEMAMPNISNEAESWELIHSVDGTFVPRKSQNKFV